MDDKIDIITDSQYIELLKRDLEYYKEENDRLRNELSKYTDPDLDREKRSIFSNIKVIFDKSQQ